MNANLCVEQALHYYAGQLGTHLDATPVAIVGPILGDMDVRVRRGVEAIPIDQKKPKAAIVLDTDGGVVELVERMVGILRHPLRNSFPDSGPRDVGGHHFRHVGRCHLDGLFHLCLGPIDPQIERDGKLVPALSYVVSSRNWLRNHSRATCRRPEMILLQKLDLADLHTYEQAKNLSVSLLVEWLSQYKFKDWVQTETQHMPVDDNLRRQRAKDIAEEYRRPHPVEIARPAHLEEGPHRTAKPAHQRPGGEPGPARGRQALL